MLALNTKVNTDYIVSSCWGLTFYLYLEKVLTLVLSFFSNWKMNSTIVTEMILTDSWSCKVSQEHRCQRKCRRHLRRRLLKLVGWWHSQIGSRGENGSVFQEQLCRRSLAQGRSEERVLTARQAEIWESSGVLSTWWRRERCSRGMDWVTLSNSGITNLLQVYGWEHSIPTPTQKHKVNYI